MRYTEWQDEEIKTYGLIYAPSNTTETFKLYTSFIVSGGWNHTGELKISKIEIRKLS
jgi:hypothetical protein